jgi:NAD(P)-dependent dehydrogenase (short-subunit alcohol dehydrogenase family)
MDKKNILIIGGSSGIGLATVQDLVQKGAKVWVISRTARTELPQEVTHMCADITEWDTPLPAIPVPLDGFVYCPGTINLKPFSSLSLTDFRNDWELNVLGSIRALQAYLKNLQQPPHASIVLISSVAATCGMPYHASIASAKGALEGLIRCLAAEFAPTIRVNGLAPSLTQTPMASFLLNTSTKRENAAKRHPLQGVAKAEEMAAIISFLLSDDASRMTGRILFGDGGLSNLRML